MEIIGKADGETYVVLVRHAELEKVFDRYYGKMPKLEVGSKVNLAEGYDFRNDIKTTCEKMTEAMSAFDSKRETLRRFAEMVLAKDIGGEGE